MKIVVLDGFTLNPGDLSWGPLQSVAPCEIFDRTPQNEVINRSIDAEIVLTNKTVLGRAEIEALPKLKYLGVLATGTNIVDLETARRRGISVTNVPAYGTRSVAQATLALLLELTQHVGQHSQSVREGRWAKSPDWCYWDRPLIELDGLTMGIVGFGRIGRAVGDLAAAFGMKLLVTTATPKSVPSFARLTDLETLFRESDVVSLHCPLTPQTRNLVDAVRLASMKPTCFLLNTSRGQLIDEQALADALNNGKLAGAGLDVLSAEPPSVHHPLLQARNCIITPHHAWATRSARDRLLQIAVENIRVFLAGNPQNVVN